MALIVVLDDEKINLKLIEIALKKDHDVVSFSHPDDFIDYLYDHPKPDLFILDLMLPGTRGDEIQAQLRDTHSLRDVPIIIQTTLNEYDELVEEMEGSFHFLKKPYRPEKIAALVNRILSSNNSKDVECGPTPGEILQKTKQWETEEATNGRIQEMPR